MEQYRKTPSELYVEILKLCEDLLYAVSNLDQSDPLGRIQHQVLQLLDPLLVRLFIDDDTDEKVKQQLLTELRLMSAATKTMDGIDIYNPEVIYIILSMRNRDEPFDMLTYVYSLADYACLPPIEVAEPATAMLDILSDGNIHEASVSWEDTLVLTLLLDIAWSAFSLLAVPAQQMLLSRYYYTGFMMGAPVRKALESYIYGTHDVIDYTIAYQRLQEGIAKNTEPVVINTKDGTSQTFLSLIQRFASLNRNLTRDALTQQTFVRETYQGQQYAGPLSSWLLDAMSLYYRIEDLTVVDKTWSLDEFGDIQQYHKEMVELLKWSFDEKTFDEIIAYYAKSNSRVPLKALLGQFPLFEDPTKEEVRDRYLALSERLREAKLLPENEDLIEFHEEDGAFHWNTELV